MKPLVQITHSIPGFEQLISVVCNERTSRIDIGVPVRRMPVGSGLTFVQSPFEMWRRLGRVADNPIKLTGMKTQADAFSLCEIAPVSAKVFLDQLGGFHMALLIQ